MNFPKILTKSIMFIALGITASFAEENTQKVLVLGANQFEEPSWTQSFAEDGHVWADHLKANGIDLATVSEWPSDSEIQYSDILGTHITLDWNDDLQLHDRLIDDNLEHFDLITNDYGVAYFIHDKTLPPILRTLTVGGKFIYGPLREHTLTPVSTTHLLTQSDVDLIKEPGDISFYRHGLGILEFGHITNFDITMAKNTDLNRDTCLSQIDAWPGFAGGHSSSFGVVTCKNLMRGFVNESFDRMTLDNFTAFINDRCDFDVEIELKSSETETIQHVFNSILPNQHPGASWGEGDWIVMTRKNKIKEIY